MCNNPDASPDCIATIVTDFADASERALSQIGSKPSLAYLSCRNAGADPMRLCIETTLCRLTAGSILKRPSMPAGLTRGGLLVINVIEPKWNENSQSDLLI